jgi:hypothetical protein
MVHVAASMAQAASTALPPLLNIIAPAVAAMGLPVTAIQWLPCSGGFWVVTGNVLNDCACDMTYMLNRLIMKVIRFMVSLFDHSGAMILR